MKMMIGALFAASLYGSTALAAVPVDNADGRSLPGVSNQGFTVVADSGDATRKMLKKLHRSRGLDDPANHDANEDVNDDGPNHDLNDDRGNDSDDGPDHDANDDHGGGSGNSGSGSGGSGSGGGGSGGGGSSGKGGGD